MHLANSDAAFDIMQSIGECEVHIVRLPNAHAEANA